MGTFAYDAPQPQLLSHVPVSLSLSVLARAVAATALVRVALSHALPLALNADVVPPRVSYVRAL